MPRSQVTPAGKVAREYCEKFPDVPSRTLARTLNEQRPKLFPSVEQARRFVRDVRGNRGTQARLDVADKTLFRPNGKAGMVLMPEPVVETWEPLRIDGPARVGVLSDIHVPYHDKSALETAVKECKRHRCDVILLNGDTIDFYGISRFEKDPERRTPTQEIRDAVQLMRWLQQQLPKARFIWKDGNHDERFSKFIFQNAPVLWSLQQVRLPNILGWEMADQTGNESTKLERYGWEYVTDKRPIMAGKLPILHGHELPGGGSPVNPSRGAYLRTAHTVLIGHLHRTSQHTEPNMFHEEVACFSTGCLSGLYPAYARINKWNWGFALVDVSADKEFDVRNLRIADGKVRAS
jgi:predicted phosphodiesterase